MKRLVSQLRVWRRQLALGVMVAIALLLSLLQSPTVAQSSGLDARVSRLESANSSLRSQMSRLESQIDRVSRGAGVSASTAPPLASDPRPTALAEDPAFRRLATLVIELRDRIAALEAAGG